MLTTVLIWIIVVPFSFMPKVSRSYDELFLVTSRVLTDPRKPGKIRSSFQEIFKSALEKSEKIEVKTITKNLPLKNSVKMT